ncbi:Small G protein signaling modulator 2 [Mactra antiquata]
MKMSATLLSKRSMSLTDQQETRQSLLRAVKKEVKQIMEEAVTRKFVHEESSSITSLCGAVESCLLHGLRKRALGLFKFSNTTALLQKVSKSFEPALAVVKLVSEIELNNDPSKKSLDTNKNQTKRQTSIMFSPKYLWIRVAIFEKHLAKILDYLVQNNSKYYESFALISDPVDGPILASLLVGPCALDYTKMKTSDHFWTDPPADELVQRHRIHSGGHHMASGAGSPGSPKRPGLQVRPQIRRNPSSSSEESSKSFHMSAREYVESLHQNSRSTLLYGKNNVLVQPKEGLEALPGYLSLHQTVEGLTIMWTPNQLMNGCCEQREDDHDRSHYWDYALTIFLDEIVYIHCHQQPDCRGTIVLVGQDGVQRPPIHFPKGGHLLAFLSCLETGLLPHGQLDPPLWSQRGKVFPKLKRKGSRLSNLSTSSKEGSTSSTSSTDIEEEATDYVFRIVKVFKPENIPPEVMDPKAKFRPADLLPWALTRIPRGPSPLAQNTVQTYAIVQEEQNNTCLTRAGGSSHRQGNTIKQLCDTMRKQIISRAFYGWLAHCRHLKTVRTHLSGLVLHRIFPVDQPCDASKGLTAEVWEQMGKYGTVTGYPEVFRLVYYGGIEHSIRKQVWPYLLGHYKFDSTQEDRDYLDKKTQTLYEKTMSEWLAIEAIIKQREKEIMAANLAKMSSESTDGNIPLVRKDSSLDNDVFLSQSFDSVDEFSHPETVPEESSATGTTCCTPDRKQSMDLHFELSDKVTQTDAISLIEKREYLTSYTTESPDDGLGDSIARQSSQERIKLDSAGDSESTDISKPDREGSIDRVKLPKFSAGSSGVEEDENEADDEGDDDDDDDDGNEEEAMDADIDGDELMSACNEVIGRSNHHGDQPTLMVEGNDTPVVDERVRQLSTSKESLMSPASPASNGGIYSERKKNMRHF